MPAADFLEFTPENWLTLGPSLRHRLSLLAQRYLLRGHGLSLDLGGFRPLDGAFLDALKRFLDLLGVQQHSDHLSFCTDDGHLYELMPLPFTEEAVRHVARRIREVSTRLERRIAIENASRYVAPGGDLTELEFLCAVLEEADCDLLLDVNNVHVNSVNHDFDPHAFIKALPTARIAWGHIAGHVVRAPSGVNEPAAGREPQLAGAVLIDTHGTAVADEVWALLETAYASHGVFPVVLERDANLPPLEALVEESRRIDACAARHPMARLSPAPRPGADTRASPSAQHRATGEPGATDEETAAFESEVARLERERKAGADTRASPSAQHRATGEPVATEPSPSLVEALQGFAAAVRDPTLPTPKGLDPERFALYRELAANNLAALLSRVFPVLCACVGEDAWQKLHEGFLRDYRPRTPYFPKLGGEFATYLETLSCEPWWVSLAAWEWLEVEVRHDPAEPGQVRVNPTLRLRHVEHEVHRLRADAPAVPAIRPHWLAVYRNTAGDVKFAEVTPVTVQLIERLQAVPAQADDETLTALAQALHWPEPARFLTAGREMIASLQSMEILSLAR